METHSAIRQSNRSEGIFAYLVFLILPLFAVILSIQRYRAAWAKNIIWLYASFFGYTFVIGNDKSDVNRYRDHFLAMTTQNYSFSEYFNYLLGSETSFDYMQPLINYLVSLFTNDFRVVFAVFGFIFGFFYSRNIWSILSLTKGKMQFISVVLIAVFAIVYAVWDINVLRFTIAAHIFFYGIFNFFVKKNRWYLLIALSAMLMHYTMSLAFGVFALYMILGKWPRIYLGLLLISMVVSELDMSVIQSQLTFLPKNLQEESNDYINEDYKEYRDEKTANKNFRGKFYQPALKYTLIFLLIYVYWFRREWLRQDPLWYGFYSFILLFFATFNILSSIPVMNRFVFLSSLFALALLVVFFAGNKGPSEKRVALLSTPFLLFYFVVKFRIGMEFTGFFSLFANPFTAPFNNDDIAFINFLK